MTRVLIPGIVGGIVMFIWGAISHMVLPIGEMGMQSLPNEDAVVSAMKQGISGPGLYFFPGMDMHKEMSKAEQAAWAAKYAAGPTGLLVYTPTGEQAMSPRHLLIELLSNIGAAIIAASLLVKISGSFASRALAVAMLGLFCWLSISVSYWNWYRFPAAFSLGEMLDQVIGWGLSGLALAKMVKPAAK